jgi:hypothetical protein
LVEAKIEKFEEKNSSKNSSDFGWIQVEVCKRDERKRKGK